MATYEYRCPQDGPFQVTLPIGSADSRSRCTVCGKESVRVFSTPMLARTPRSLALAIDRTESSSETPEVVSRIPAGPSPARRRPPNPAHARLPRL
ncbi:FmdB family zinc ribbon protein [Micromonospora sonneratiae]|uniref:Zinc ribbon domain-containing protein n=1 Tax=Micromonospora sonneratiae TaxID=1184706 RepID=A0ABW3YL00_9ACTN